MVSTPCGIWVILGKRVKGSMKSEVLILNEESRSFLRRAPSQITANDPAVPELGKMATRHPLPEILYCDFDLFHRTELQRWGALNDVTIIVHSDPLSAAKARLLNSKPRFA